MNSKGQIVGFIGSVIVFLIVWALFLGKWLNEWTNYTITANNLTGIEAFLLANLNLFVLVFLILGIFIYLRFASQ
jgi:hypothetical protein